MGFGLSGSQIALMLIKVNGGGGYSTLLFGNLVPSLKTHYSVLSLYSIQFTPLFFTRVFSLLRSYFFQGTVRLPYSHYAENIYRVFSSLWRREDLVRGLQISFLIKKSRV